VSNFAVVKEKKARPYDRTACCFYCKKMVKLNMPRHLIHVHGHETEAAKVLSCKYKQQKRLELVRLTNRGNFNYNCRLIEEAAVI